MTSLGESLTAMAFESTTTISANRIEAACQGWSEELFLEVIDSLFIADAEIGDQEAERLVVFWAFFWCRYLRWNLCCFRAKNKR